jgi:hypothetical protein
MASNSLGNPEFAYRIPSTATRKVTAAPPKSENKNYNHFSARSHNKKSGLTLLNYLNGAGWALGFACSAD